MTDNKSFAYRLFKAIRANKRKLLAARPDLPMYADNYKDCEALQSLIDAMFSFEKFARGSQTALAGEYVSKNFTLKYRKRGNQHPHNDYLNFVKEAKERAEAVVAHMLNCQSMLVGSFWQEMLSLEGLESTSFNRVARSYVLVRLPGLRTAVRQRSVGGFSVSFTETFILEMEFANGAAVNKQKHPFPVPNMEGKTLEQQIAQMNLYWTEIKHCAREASKSPANWPTLLDSKKVELDDVKDMLTRFYRGLRPEQKALIQKYPDEVKQFFNNAM